MSYVTYYRTYMHPYAHTYLHRSGILPTALLESWLRDSVQLRMAEVVAKFL